MDSAQPNPRRVLAGRLLSLLDLTSLGEDDTPARIESLCDKARTRWGDVAAVCVYPEHVTSARRHLGSCVVQVASVVNFPDAGEHLGRVVRETRRALAAGADEIDMVLPWRALLRGDEALCSSMVAAVRANCPPGKVLKLIVESGELGSAEALRRACAIGIEAGVDFLKTSSGKVAVNATPEAAQVMLACIADAGGDCGFKAAGGIRSFDDAVAFLELAESSLGAAWVTPQRFRIGASSLLDELLEVLEAAD
jgi:deoxyribose-phosphate aldolase